MKRFPFFRQLDAKDCGPACLRMIAKFYGKNYSLQSLREKSYISREGVSLLGISDAAESLGFRTMGVNITFEQLMNDAPLPCIVHWKQNHFMVVVAIKGETIIVADPAHDILKLTKQEFLSGWLSSKGEGIAKGIALLLEPAPDFYNNEDEKPNTSGFKYLFRYLTPQKPLILQLILGVFLISVLQLIFPFLTQSIVDKGIGNLDMGFINLVLIAMLVLTFSRTFVDFIRNWILLHIGTRININLISDFLIKLMKLPVGFFDSKLMGDILQRIWDHNRIQNFLTSSSLSILFGLFSIVVFSVVLAVYNYLILLIFLVGSIFYFFWIRLFMKQRRDLDFKRFAQLSENQSNLYQLITGMQEIKLNNCEKQKRWKWEQIQARLFKINVASLSLTQYQQVGGVFINETKNIIITYLAARAVVTGEMSLGMMMAVQYIIGQMNGPVDQMIGFMQTAQDARISLERLGEVHKMKNEEETGDPKITIFPEKKFIKTNHLTFHYEGPNSPTVLDQVSLTIPEGKVTAIVGSSGSGKTTLIKMLLGFYSPTEGEIRIGDIRLDNISLPLWRNKCGTVMQDGFIFSESIAENIAVSEESIDKQKLMHAVKVANIQDFIESLPLGYNTKIGQEGSGLSQGQKQRILIARAVYKDPEYLFFDEATNALDAENETIIMNNLNEFFKGKTVVIVAHRLSTVKNADQILVMDKGKIIETGNHQELVALKGNYFHLVKNQLELGN